MIIRKYGIELHRVTHADIELIRETRNSETVRQYMFDQAEISEKQQQQWFTKINTDEHYYFIIHHDGERIGLINGKNADFKQRHIEGGIYIWSESAKGGIAPAIASICFMEATFNLLAMSSVYAHIRPDNRNAILYNQSLGYKEAHAIKPNLYILTKTDFEKRSSKLRRLAAAGKSEPPLGIADIEIKATQENLNLYKNLPDDVYNNLLAALPETLRR